MKKSIVLVGVFAAAALGGAWWYRTQHVPLAEAKAAYEAEASRAYGGTYRVSRALGSDPREGHLAPAAPGQRRFRPEGEMRMTVHGVVYYYDEETIREDGDEVFLRARQVVRYDPPGAQSAFGARSRVHTHEVVVRREGGVWRVASLEEISVEEGG